MLEVSPVLDGPDGSTVLVPGSPVLPVAAESVPCETLPPSVVVGGPSLVGSPLVVCPPVAGKLVWLVMPALSESPLAPPPSSPHAKIAGDARHNAAKPNLEYRIATS